jgi:hypothetical protein
VSEAVRFKDILVVSREKLRELAKIMAELEKATAKERLYFFPRWVKPPAPAFAMVQLRRQILPRAWGARLVKLRLRSAWQFHASGPANPEGKF